MAIHTGSPLSKPASSKAQRAVFPKQPKQATVGGSGNPNANANGRHVLSKLPELCRYGQANEPTRRFTLLWALSHVLLVT